MMEQGLRRLAFAIAACWVIEGCAAEVPVVPQTPVPSPISSLSALQAGQLLKEYRAALAAEKKSLIHRQQFELQELDASQRARSKDWEKNERKLRREFFEKNKHGKERRVYVQDLISRRKAFKALLNGEKRQRRQGHKARLEALIVDQKARFSEFDTYLKNNEVPPNRLWPQAGR